MKHKELLEAMAASERAELYFAAHPGSPAAVRRPRLSIRSGKWVAVLGRSVQNGIVGIGPTIETALRAFDDPISGRASAAGIAPRTRSTSVQRTTSHSEKFLAELTKAVHHDLPRGSTSGKSFLSYRHGKFIMRVELCRARVRNATQNGQGTTSP